MDEILGKDRANVQEVGGAERRVLMGRGITTRQINLLWGRTYTCTLHAESEQAREGGEDPYPFLLPCAMNSTK